MHRCGQQNVWVFVWYLILDLKLLQWHVRMTSTNVSPKWFPLIKRLFRLPIRSPFAHIQQKNHINRTGTTAEKQRDETWPPEWIGFDKEHHVKLSKTKKKKNNNGKEMHIKFFPRYLNIKAYALGDNTLGLFWRQFSVHRLKMQSLFDDYWKAFLSMNMTFIMKWIERENDKKRTINAYSSLIKVT